MHRMGEIVEKTADEALRANGKKEQTATADATEFLTNVLASAPVKGYRRQRGSATRVNPRTPTG
jgi:hypothetical protein